MLKQVTLALNPLEPSTWTRHEVDDIRAFLVTQFDRFPDTGRIFHGTVAQINDVTPANEKDIERLGELPGPFYVVVYPAAFLVPYLPYIFAAVVAIAAYVLAPSPTAAPLVANRNTQAASPNNELSDRSNRARPNQRIPDIYGTVRSIPDLIAAPYKIFVAGSEVEYAYMCIGRGAYEVDDIRDGETLCKNIQGTSIAIYAPYTSPNSGDAPQIQIGSAITEKLIVAERCNSVNGQVLKPPKSATFVGDNNTAFVYPNRIVLQAGQGKPFTDYFAAGDTITLSNAAIDGGVPFSAEFKQDPNAAAPMISNTRTTYPYGPTYPGYTYLEETMYFWSWSDEYTAWLLNMFQPASDITITQNTFRGDYYNTTTTIDLSGTYEIEEVYTQQAEWADYEYVAVKLLNPASVNTDWNRIATEVNYYLVNDLTIESAGGGLTFDLAGTYTIVAVEPEQILLDDPASVNSDWNLLSSVTSSAYMSPTIVSDPGPKWVGPFILDDDERVGAYLNFVASNGLYKDDGTDQFAVTVEIGVEMTPVDANDEPTGAAQYFTTILPGSSTDKQTVARTMKVETGFVGRCSIRVTRVTETDDAFTGTVVDEVRWRDAYSTAPVIETDFGNVTTAHTVTFATASALAVKERKLNALVQRKVPQRVSGNTFTTDLFATNDSAEILAAVCRDRYIGNRPIAELDIANFYDTADEVEAYFGTPVVREFNYTFDKDNFSFEETVNAIAGAMFCTAYRRGNVIKLSFEKETDDSTLLFNHRNKLPGTEKRAVTFGKNNDNDGIEYSYVDPADDSLITIFLPENYPSTNPKKVESIGVRDHVHAYFHAWRLWNRIRYQNTTVEFDATQEADLLVINDRILVTDGTRPYTQDGEVTAVDTLELTLSQNADLTEYASYVIFLQHTDGVAESIGITAGSAANKVVLDSAPRLALVTDPEMHVRTAYVIVGNTESKQTAFLVAEKTPQGKMTSTVIAVNYDARYYANDPDYINEVIGGGGYGGGGGWVSGSGYGYREDDDDGELIVWPNAVLDFRSQTGIGTLRTPDAYSADGGVVTLSGGGKAMVWGQGNFSVRITGTDIGGGTITEDLSVTTATIGYETGTTTFYTITGVTLLSTELGADGFYTAGYQHQVSVGASGYNLVRKRGAVVIRDNVNTGTANPAGLLGDLSFPITLPTDSKITIMRWANTYEKNFTINSSEVLNLPTGSKGQEVVSEGEYDSLTSLVLSNGTSGTLFFDVGIEYREVE